MVIPVKKQGSDMTCHSDFCILYNSDVYNGHYSAICRDDQMLLITEKVTPKEGYRKELDIEWERKVQAKEMGFRFEGTGMGSSSGSDMVLVSGEMFEGLLKGRQFAEKVRTFVVSEEGRGTGGGTGRGSSSRIIEEKQLGRDGD